MFAWQDARVMRTLVFILARRVPGLVVAALSPTRRTSRSPYCVIS
jgi:hypothetical protein